MTIKFRGRTADPGAIYARKGEMVYCENGHPIGRIARDIITGDVTDGREIEGIVVTLGDPYPTCKCGGYFTLAEERGVTGFLFKDEEANEIVGRRK